MFPTEKQLKKYIENEILPTLSGQLIDLDKEDGAEEFIKSFPFEDDLDVPPEFWAWVTFKIMEISIKSYAEMLGGMTDDESITEIIQSEK